MDIIKTYQPGMKSSKIVSRHRQWLIDNCRSLAVELGLTEAAASVA